MGKQATPRALPENEAKAVARMLRVSPQKLNLVAQMIRGKKVDTALAELQFSRKRISTEVKKCLESAIANAENNHDLDWTTSSSPRPSWARRWFSSVSTPAPAAAVRAS